MIKIEALSEIVLPANQQSIATLLFSGCNHSVANKVDILREEQKSSVSKELAKRAHSVDT